MHGHREFGVCQRYVFDRPGQVFQHDQWYFVSVSRPGQLFISHNVEHGHKMKITHDRRGSINFLELRWYSQGGKNSACNERIPSHAISQRKLFTFFEFQQVGRSFISEYTVGRDPYNVTSVNCWSMHLKCLLDTSNLIYQEMYKEVYKVELESELVCRAMNWKKNITRFRKSCFLIAR